MGIIDPVMAEFKLEAANTRKALERVPEGRFDWKPHPKSWTLAELASHIAEIPEWLGGILGTDEMVLGEGDYKPFLASNRKELLERFDQSAAQAVEQMQGAEEEEWSRNWKIRAGEKVLWEQPRIHVVKTMLINHAIQHRGQLTVYLRLCDVPVPSIYGPSADERGY